MIKFDYETDAGIGVRANLGLIVLQADETVEPVMQQLFSLDGVALYHTRIPSATEITAESLQDMKQEIATAVNLLPGAVEFDAIGFACTSASTVIGESVIEKLVQQYQPDALVTNPATAVKAALRALGARRVALVAPYVPEVVEEICETLEQDGFEMATVGTFDQISDSIVARIDEQSIFNAIIQAGQAADCDAVFVSCTNLRAANVIQDAESALGIPVVSSNQALGWHMLRLAKVRDAKQGYGKLFSDH